LRERRFCCQSGCRHCPYGFTKTSTPLPTTQTPSADPKP
jgi:hypothetical protein